MKFLEKIRRYIKISEVAPISRRYFIMNAFDGATTILGIVIGAYAAEITNESWVIWSGLGVSLAMGLSGFVGAYMTEEAEREKKLNALEKSMLTELTDSVVGKASRFAFLWAGIVDGVSPALAAVVCLTPFFLSSHGLFSINFAIQLSVAVALSIMFLLGVFLGKISNRNMLFHGAKMLFVGLIITFIFFMLKITQ
jgi:predicted membrane protein (TIGR00267 family)